MVKYDSWRNLTIPWDFRLSLRMLTSTLYVVEQFISWKLIYLFLWQFSTVLAFLFCWLLKNFTLRLKLGECWLTRKTKWITTISWNLLMFFWNRFVVIFLLVFIRIKMTKHGYLLFYLFFTLFLFFL